MNKKTLHQLLFLLSCLALQNNAINGMKRPIGQITNTEKTKYPPLKQQKRDSNAAALVCDICNKNFSSKSYLTIHTRTHTGEKPYTCSLCNKIFPQKGHLTAHEKIHTGEKSYPCSFCNKSFFQKGHLIDHEKTHTGEKPHTCPTCNESFSQKSNLRVHTKIHTGEKPFSCSLCDKSFTQKIHLTTHMKTHTQSSTSQINSSNASSKKTPTYGISTRLIPLVIQKTIETAQAQKNETVIEEAMKPLSDKDFQNWISSEKFS